MFFVANHLKGMGWEWLEGDKDVPDLTERGSFHEVLLKGRLAAALTRINLRDGVPWLDESRTAKAIRDVEQAAGHRLMEINQAATELLLKGTVAGMLRPAHLLDLIRNFTVFQQVDGKTRKVVARYQQFRAIHKAVIRLLEGRSRLKGVGKVDRGGIIWHTQGSGTK